MLTAPDTVAAQFRETAESYSEKLAFEQEGQKTTYRSLLNLVKEKTNLLEGIIERPEFPVGLTQNTDLDLVVTILALAELGCPFVYLDSTWSSSRTDEILQKSEAQLIPDAACSRPRPEHPHQPRQPTCSSPFMLTSTSGSSGAAKLVVRSQGSVVTNLINYRATSRVLAEHRIALTALPSYGPFVSQLLGGLLCGASVHPFDLRQLGIESFASWLKEHEISHIHLVPSVFRRLAKHVTAQRISLDDLHTVRLGGESVTAADVKLFREAFSLNTRFLNGYSSSEASGNICCFQVDRDADYSDTGVPAGPPVAGREISIVDSQGSDLPPLEEGRIVITSADLADGYWNDKELTKKTFREIESSKQWWSEDRGYLSKDGSLVVLGRMDKKVKVLGRMVDLDRTARDLMLLPSIRNAVCQRVGSEGLVAFLETDLEPTPTRLMEWRGALSQESSTGPWRFVCCRHFPLTANGKVDLQALQKDCQPVDTSQGTQPIHHGKDNLCHTLGLILKRKVSCDDNFFQLGGNSLLAAEWVATLSKLGVTLELGDIVSTSTLGELSQRLRSRPCQRLLPLCEKPGTRPLILIPGNTGKVLEFIGLQPTVQGLSRTVFGLDVLGGPPPQNLAALVRENVRTLQMLGPENFDLLGWCSGARVALEVARELQGEGRKVRVILIDPPPPNSSEVAQKLRRSRGLARDLLTSLGRTGTHFKKLTSGPLRDRTRHANHLLRTANLLLRFKRWTPPDFPREVRENQRRTYSEWSRTEPWEPYPFSVIVFLSDDRRNTRERWKNLLCGDASFHTLIGNHDDFCLRHWDTNLEIINRVLM